MRPKEGYMKPTGDRLGRWEKAKWGNLWDCIKQIDTCFFYIGG